MREADSTPVGTDGRLRLFMEDLLTPFKVAQIKIDNEYEEKRKVRSGLISWVPDSAFSRVSKRKPTLMSRTRSRANLGLSA